MANEKCEKCGAKAVHRILHGDFEDYDEEFLCSDCADKSAHVYRCGLCGFSESRPADGDVVWTCPKCEAAYHALTGE